MAYSEAEVLAGGLAHIPIIIGVLVYVRHNGSQVLTTIIVVVFYCLFSFMDLKLNSFVHWLLDAIYADALSNLLGVLSYHRTVAPWAMMHIGLG